jgi:hypothetical protein
MFRILAFHLELPGNRELRRVDDRDRIVLLDRRGEQLAVGDR